MSSRDPGATGRSFELERFHGELATEFRPHDPEREIARLTDPGAAAETLHWGRNYLYTVEVGDETGEREVVVKQFRNQGWRRRLRKRLKGSKAEKSWRTAAAVEAAGVCTPSPLAWLEENSPEGPSYYVCERLTDFVEARYYFRALHAGRLAEEFPAVDRAELLSAFGRVARSLHDAGIRYRDFSIGNLLVRYEGDARPIVYLVDLNRARIGSRVGTFGRMRDASRLPIQEAEDRRIFLQALLGKEPGTAESLFYGLAVDLFLARNRFKAAVRSPFKAIKTRLRPRHAHVHIPAPDEGASPRDKSVWDPLTEQPHQHASRWERTRVRLADLGDHALTLGAALAVGPRLRHRYRELAANVTEGEKPWGLAGVAVRPHGPVTDQVATLEELGVRQILLRLHPWQEDHVAELELARALAARGFELSFALPQTRALVRDKPRWQAAVRELGELFAPFGRHFQIGQAINRSKWGVWSYGEYLELAAAASEILRRWDGVQILGPAVIDFEFHFLAGVLNRRTRGLHFDVVTSLLYVDRRGAPENTQLGFDTAAKSVLLRALAETARNAAPRAWITEVNWPLWEGPHSPAGKGVSVDEESQADYLVRYYLEVFATGLVERIYWWRDFAKGYGLIDPTDGRRRPSFHAFRTLEERLGGATVLGRRELPEPARALAFRDRGGAEILVAWSTGAPIEVELPGEVGEAEDRDGRPMALTGRRVRLSSSPMYLSLR